MELDKLKEELKGILNNPYKSKFSNDLTEEIDETEEDDDLSFVGDDPENYIDIEAEDSAEINAQDEALAMGNTEITETPFEDEGEEDMGMGMGMEDGMSQDPIEVINSKMDSILDKISAIEDMISGESVSDEEVENDEDDLSDDEIDSDNEDFEQDEDSEEDEEGEDEEEEEDTISF